MPTLNSPLKNNTSFTEPKHILQMLALLIQDINSTIQIDKYDFSQSSPSYTVNTIRNLQERYPKSSISMIIGADQLVNFHHWKDYNEIINSVNIIVFNRGDYDFTPLPGMNITWIDDFNMNISSKEIRNDIVKGELKTTALTSSVKKYIIENKLYVDV